MGIEPTSSAWKAEVLPLNYTRQTHCRCILTSCRPPGQGRAEPDIWWRGEDYTPGILPFALRAAAPCATFEIARSDFVNLHRFKLSPAKARGKSNIWWRGEDLNLRRLSRQIYSLIPLTTREPLQNASPLLSCRRWWLSTAKDAVAGHEAREYHHRIRGCVGRKYNYKYSLGKRVSRHGLSAN